MRLTHAGELAWEDFAERRNIEAEADHAQARISAATIHKHAPRSSTTLRAWPGLLCMIPMS
ncbi:MAG: hypothetical protein ABW187_11100 [Dokdonella sp.]